MSPVRRQGKQQIPLFTNLPCLHGSGLKPDNKCIFVFQKIREEPHSSCTWGLWVRYFSNQVSNFFSWDTTPQLDAFMLFSGSGQKESIIMRPRAAPNNPSMGIFFLSKQIEFEAVWRLTFKQGPLTVTGNWEQVLIILGELKLDYSQFMSSEAASRHCGLPLSHVPDNNVSILLLLRLASTCGDVSLVRSSDAEHFKHMAVKLLLLWPQRTCHEYVLNWRLSNLRKNFFVLVFIR